MKNDNADAICAAVRAFLASKKISMTEAAERIGQTKGAVSAQLNSRPFSQKSAARWAEAFGFSVEFLTTGSGQLMAESLTTNSQQEPHTVPLLPIFAQAGSLTGWSEGIEEVKCERVISPVQDVDMAVHIYGESMYPDIPNGSVCYVKRVKAVIEWGRAFILDTVDGPLLKYLTPGSDEAHVRCVSANHDPRYAPFEVAKEDILGIYRVVMCMSMK